MAQKKKQNRRAGKKVSSVKRKTGKIWVAAVDPFSELQGQSVVDFALHLGEAARAFVEPVYVLSPASFNWTGEFSGPWLKKYLPMAQARMQELFGDKGRVIPCKDSGTRAAVKALVTHAQSVGAETIFISTHARHGLERLAMGSFAETLILASKIPVTVLNPKAFKTSQINKVLIPTDLSKASKSFVMAMTEQAKKWGAELVLFYKQPDPLDPIIQQGIYSLGGGWVSMQNFIETELAEKIEALEKIEGMIKSDGVKVSHVIDSSPTSLIESINKVAQEQKADMIAIFTQAGPTTANVLGSVARGLVRESSVPVMIRR